MAQSTAKGDERLPRLERLGVPSTPARAYLALLDLGETEARQVSRLSGIPYAKVYAALDDLQGRGLATVALDTPRRYAARPLQEYVDTLRRSREEDLKRLDADAAELATLLRPTRATDGDDRGSFSMLRGRRASVKRIAQSIERAQDELLLLSSAGFPLRAGSGARLLADALARGVRVKVLAQGRAAEAGALPPVVEVRETTPFGDAEHVAILIVDRTTAIVVQFVPDDADLRQGHDVGIMTSQRAIVASLAHLLDAKWASAG